MKKNQLASPAFPTQPPAPRLVRQRAAAPPPAPLEAEIRAVCHELAEMLVAKNRAYGNSALDPVRVFSKAPLDEQLRVRLDDKLSRLARGQAAGEDPEWDILGYLVLLRISKQKRAAK